jgi:predicted transcriptional regulator
MCTILLPIKPEYAKKIVNKTKIYEYRKSKCKKNVDKIVIYCTSPVKKIIAEVEVKSIISNTPIKLWNDTKEFSGISKSKYIKYFENKDTAFAYELGNVILYDIPKTLNDIGINYYPQSYVYLDD